MAFKKLLLRSMEAWIPPSTGFSPYRTPGLAVSAPVLVMFLAVGWILCGWDPRLWVFLPFYFVAGFALGPPIAVAAHYAPLLTLVVLGGFIGGIAKLQTLLAVHQAGMVFGLPLHRAVRAGELEALREVLGGEAQVDASDRSGQTALHLTAINLGGADETARCPMAEALLAAGADPNLLDGAGKSALHYAAYWGQSSVAGVLLAHGAEHGIEDGEGSTPLSLMGYNDDDGVILQLLAAGADVNAERPGGGTLLHNLGWSHKAHVLAAALEHGADTEAKDHRGRTPIHTVHDGAPLVTLVEHGADPHSRDDGGRTALHSAVWLRDGGPEAVQALLRAGAAMDAEDGEGATPLLEACGRTNPETARVLVDAGAEVNHVDASGRNALHHLAAAGEHYQAVEAITVMAEAGCDINARDGAGDTPLHVAVEEFKKLTSYRREDFVPVLAAFVKAGAGLGEKNAKGLTPGEVARALKLEELLGLLG